MVFVFILIFLLVAGCNNVEHNIELGKSLNSIVVDKTKGEISLKSITTFDWEKAFLFTPYSTQKGIEEELGIDFKDPSNIDFRDDIYLMVFVNDDQVIQYVEVERQGADFTIGEKKYLTPSDDVIQINRF